MKCRHCGKDFVGRGNSKYCPDCRHEVQLERLRRYNEQRKKNTAKKIRTLTEDDIYKLMNLIRDAYRAGWLILNFGEQSALTDEQLAVVELKYPDHCQTLGDRRKQKFFDAADKFIKLYQTFKRSD